MTSKVVKGAQSIDAVKKQINPGQKSKVEEITIEESKITSLDKGLFSGFSSLTALYLSNNEIQKVNNGVFDGMAQLKYLYLNRNNIQTLGGEIFKGLTKLNDLDLSNNKIAKLPPGLFQNFSMTSSGAYLNLSHNIISDIGTDAFRYITVLCGTLDVSNNKLTHLATASCNNLLAEKFDLSKNLIESIEECAFQPSNFKFLHLDNNKISKVHPEAFKGLEIQNELHLSNNKVSSYAGLFYHLVNLKELYLDNNGISSLPADGFKGLISLDVLSLRSNNISAIEKNSFSGCTKLEYLYLNGNKLTKFDSVILKNLSELRHLNLSHNKFTSLPANTFVAEGDKAFLISLSLANNQLAKIENGAFNGLDRIDDLRLNKNKLTKVDEGTFKGLSFIGILDLQDNEIDSINLLSVIPDSRHIKLGGNKFKVESGIPISRMVSDSVERVSFKNSCYKKDQDKYLYDEAYVEEQLEE